MMEILDTTLRDGMQGKGVSYSKSDKLQVISALRELGIAMIEIGNPSSCDVDKQLAMELTGDDLVAFGATRRKDINARDDKDLQFLKDCNIPNIAIFGKSSLSHVTTVLGVSAQENLDIISQSIAFLVAHRKSVIFDAEHFFDGYMEDSRYAIKTLQIAKDAGATRLVLCDTNGATMIEDIARITTIVSNNFPDTIIGIHCHNDCGIAVAQSLVAISSGATHAQGTLLGMGERCGNTCLATLIPNLVLKYNQEILPFNNLSKLHSTARVVAELTNCRIDDNAPYIGTNAFTHKAGMHGNAVIKSANSFEHVEPSAVGNNHNIIVSSLAGRANILAKLNEFFAEHDFDSVFIRQLLDDVKARDIEGYSYDIAEGSFYLYCLQKLGKQHEFFDTINYSITSPSKGENSAQLSLRVDGDIATATNLGVGPVHAIDKALRHALKEHYPILNTVNLVDYKVRVIDSGNATWAKVRVLITSTDGNNDWTTVGVGDDVIKASYQALCDSINYILATSSRNA